jgi:hypothetical protein
MSLEAAEHWASSSRMRYVATVTLLEVSCSECGDYWITCSASATTQGLPRLAWLLGMQAADSPKAYAVWPTCGVTFFGIERVAKVPILRIDSWSSESTSGGQGFMALPAFTRFSLRPPFETRPPNKLPTQDHNQILHDRGCIR